MVSASQAILKGLANGGGLFVPTFIPKLDVSLEDLSKMTYQQTAYEVMKLFLTDFTKEELENCINRAYDAKFEDLKDALSGRFGALMDLPDLRLEINRCILSPEEMADDDHISQKEPDQK
mgnify:FL=1